ncbi:MAG: glycyl-radical enzyme activating protein [Capsulimonadales bacterium]|nr:glycyl-radical enzyme activating protein [Capsulimonadales bacterium]
MKGLVLDIQRFSLDAGPGIRTTVLLKGCPLRCVWCHSPESQKRVIELAICYERCADCAYCGGSDCPAGVRYAEVNPEPYLERNTGNHPCRNGLPEACPEEAVERMGEWRTSEEVLEVVEKDRCFHDRSGGGMTVSGGEPMAQFAFTEALLRGAKRRGIPTCLDTSGYAPTPRFEALLPLVDLFLFDIKATDPEEHRRRTGVTNELILANLEFLHDRGANLILRLPLVPGMNDTSDHLRGIADLVERYPRMAGVEILPYRGMGRDKAVRIGREADLLAQSDATEENGTRWLESLRALGCVRATIK